MLETVFLLFLSTPVNITDELNTGFLNAYGTNESVGISFEIKKELRSY